MPKKTPSGEMPFLDHLEELRWRILWSLLALAVGTVIGFFVVQGFDVLALLKQPIAPFLPDGKLHVLRPADAFIITLKLALLVGVALALPVIVSQIWAFIAPALYAHERRYLVPALLAGFVLFVIGAVMAYLWVLPAVLRILFSFQHQDLEFMITADAYFGFAAQMIVAFGLLFELPLVMVILGALGLVSPDAFARQRPLALIVGAVVAALLTPPDALSMVLMLGPVLVLYEAGILLARLAVRRRRRREHSVGTVAVLLLLAAWPGSAVGAQQQERDTTRAADSLGVPLDTAAARRLGLPTQPSRSFPAPDSVMRALMALPGYTVLRYMADTIALLGATKEIVLDGAALVDREGATLEADSVNFLDRECRLDAAGNPVLFQEGTVLVGEGMHYDTCLRRGTVASALTSFQQSGVRWFLRGNLGIDSASTRIYGGTTNLTSCDVPEPHYYFRAGKVKWVSNTIMVARPATLYVRDVPVMWLPFIFQDMRQGRRTGLLIPRFGFSDLIRPNTGFRRQVQNIGYYVVLNDYTDVQASVDWLSGNYIALNGQFRYRWLNRFVTGGVGLSRVFEEGVEDLPGGRSSRLQWTHQQNFDQRTSLNASVDYATSARVVQRNTVDPLVQTADLGSQLAFAKRYGWGTLSIGGTRRQDLSSGTITQTLPSVSLSPAPIDLASNVTWSPGFSFGNAQTLHQTPGLALAQPPLGGVPTVDTLFPDARLTRFSFQTPLRIAQWNWRNDLSVVDSWTNRPPPPLRLPDPDSPGDTLTRYYGEDFRTELDWNTGIGLPSLSGGRWNLQPSIGIRNSTGGSFLLRNRFTDGRFVSQGKRLDFGASIAPTLFGFFPGLGPLERVRHAISPSVRWSYAPPATVPEAYARARNPTAAALELRSPTLHAITFGLHQTFEGKLRPPPDDTTGGRDARKIKLLSIQTTSVTFDFEQAKLEGRTGWQTSSLTNNFTSDLVPGFSISTTHDLWRGTVGYDTTRFDPFLTSISARFGVSAATFRSIASMLAGGAPVPAPPDELQPVDPQEAVVPQGSPFGQPPGVNPGFTQMTDPRSARSRGFTASVDYNDQRRRPIPGVEEGTLAAEAFGANRTMGLSVAFAPTPGWSASWSTQYNLTAAEFQTHTLRLDRDLHRWRATFSFIKAPNGNFAFNFFVSLTDQPEIKFQYDQRTVNR